MLPLSHRIPPITRPASLPLSLRKPNLEIRTGAKGPAPLRPRDHDALDAIVDVDGVEDADHLVGHGLGEGVEFVRAVEGEEEDGRWDRGGGGDVGEGDVLCGEGGVGGREGGYGCHFG